MTRFRAIFTPALPELTARVQLTKPVVADSHWYSRHKPENTPPTRSIWEVQSGWFLGGAFFFYTWNLPTCKFGQNMSPLNLLLVITVMYYYLGTYSWVGSVGCN